MTQFFKAIFLFLSLVLIQCNADDASGPGNIRVNAAEFKTGGSPQLNVLKSDSQNGFLIEIRENTTSGQRGLQVMAVHETGARSGTYALRSNFIAQDIALVTLMDVENDQQLAGGALEQPTGTITVTDYGNNTLKIEFNNVTLDPGTPSETTISGTHTAKFRVQL